MCTAARMGRGTPAGGRCPACAAACGVPAERPRETEAPRGRRSAWVAACGTPAGADAPRAAAYGGRPAECPRGLRPRVYGGPHGPRNAREGPMSRAWRRPAGGLRNASEGRCPACTAARMGRGTPARTDVPGVQRAAWAAEPPREADAPRVQRPAECLPNARGRPMPPAHNAGGAHSASPQTVEQSFARGLPGRGSAGPSARRDRPPANPAACAVNQAS